jgi:uncharacterized membrane protein HdeD (DUF308 family)
MNATHKLWWLWIMRSLVTAAFAMIAIAFPPLNTALAVYLYGAYVKLDGFLLIGLNTSEQSRSLLIAGVFALGSGVAILLWPLAAPESLLYTLAALAIARGGLEGFNSFRNTPGQRERTLRVGSATAITAGGVILAAHEPLALPVLIGGFAIQASLASVFQLAVGIEQWSHHMQQPTPPERGTTRSRAPLSGQPM